MSEEKSQSQKTSQKEDDKSSLKRGFEFLRTVLDIEGSIKSLKDENKNLTEQVALLERDVIELKGQQVIILNFIKSAMDDKIDARARAATAEMMDRYLSFLGSTSSMMIVQNNPDDQAVKKQSSSSKKQRSPKKP